MSSLDDRHHDHPVDPARVTAARARLPTTDETARMAAILSLIADPTRARILYALDMVEELCVGDLARALDSNEDAIGYALRLLRTAGLVTKRKEGRIAYYCLSEGFPQPLRDHCLRQLVSLSRTNPTDDTDEDEPDT